VRAGKKEDKMGWRASDTRELILEDAEVPVENRLGEEGEGFVNFMRTLDAGRIGIGALALGLAQGAFDALLAVAATGDPRFRDSQGAQFRLADLATEIAAARHLVYHAAWLRENGRRYGHAAAMAKLYASELAVRAASAAIQLLGAEGLLDEHPVERILRDAKICEIGEGTSEIQRLVIARHLLREVGAS
jgi:butyryl-CoA dehydrogenase